MSKSFDKACAAVAFVGALAIGAITVPTSLNNLKSIQSSKAYSVTLQEKVNSLNNNADSLRANLEQQGAVICTSNYDIASAISLLGSAKITKIAAQKTIDSGEYYDIVTVDNVDDVSYFTSSVECMLFTLKSTDVNATLSALNNAGLLFDYIDVNYKTKIIQIRIPAITPDSDTATDDVSDDGSLANEDTAAINSAADTDNSVDNNSATTYDLGGE